MKGKMSQIRPIHHPEAIAQACAILNDGGLVVVPTDTVYGVACNLFDEAAIARLFIAKQRPADKAIPVLLADLAAAETVATHIPEQAAQLAARFWPGPLTLTLPKRPDLPPNLSAFPTVGVRVPDHAGCRALLRAAGGALAVTSANRSGGENPTRVEDARKQLGDYVALYLDDGTSPRALASTVVMLDESGFRILREGPISAAAIAAALNSEN